MGTDKRERQKANRALRIQEAEAAQKKADQRRSLRSLVIVGGVALALAAVFVFFGRRNQDVAATPLPCPNVDGSSPRTTTFGSAPKMCIDPAKAYTAKVVTSKGEFTLALDAKAAPLAVNNFVVLSRFHFYDGLTFHRVIPDFVAQGGDPKGNGSGGPGYKFADELPASAEAYQPGVMAMANSGPNTNGSQFYIVLAPGRLEPKYSILGKITEGFDTTVKAIATGESVGEPPAVPATITTITITES